MPWGKWLAELIPFHWHQLKRINSDLQRQCAANIDHLDHIKRLESDLRESAEARVRAEDQSRFMQARMADLQAQNDILLSRLFSTHEKTADFLALAASGGRRALFSDPQPDQSGNGAGSEPLHQPITTGKMRAADLRAVATRAAEAEDRRRAEEARRLAQQLRQQAASERDADSDADADAPKDTRSPEQRKAAQDIAQAFEQEILGTAV